METANENFPGIKRYHEGIKSTLSGFDFDTLESSPHSIFGLSKELRFIYFNLAWFRFAKLNNGEPGISTRYPLGATLESAISGTLKSFYIERYAKVLSDRKVWKHEYECSGAGIYRLFSQDVYPMKDGEGLMVVNSLKIEKDTDEFPGSSEPLNEYTDLFGIITQCSNCRKTQQPLHPDTWDWVPAYVKQMPENVSHSICPVCYDYYWKQPPALQKKIGYSK